MGRPFQEEGPLMATPNLLDMNSYSWETRWRCSWPRQRLRGAVFSTITADTRLLWTFYKMGKFTLAQLILIPACDTPQI